MNKSFGLIVIIMAGYLAQPSPTAQRTNTQPEIKPSQKAAPPAQQHPPTANESVKEVKANPSEAGRANPPPTQPPNSQPKPSQNPPPPANASVKSPSQENNASGNKSNGNDAANTKTINPQASTKAPVTNNSVPAAAKVEPVNKDIPKTNNESTRPAATSSEKIPSSQPNNQNEQAELKDKHQPAPKTEVKSQQTQNADKNNRNEPINNNVQADAGRRHQSAPPTNTKPPATEPAHSATTNNASMASKPAAPAKNQDEAKQSKGIENDEEAPKPNKNLDHKDKSTESNFAEMFSQHYQNFVFSNIDLLEKIYNIIAEKAYPYYSAAKASKIASSIIIGFLYTYLILRFAMKILPSKRVTSGPDTKAFEKHLERIEGQIREIAASRSESDKKLDVIMKRVNDLQNSFEAYKNDKADDEFLDYLGKNIEDVWKEIGIIKTRNNDNDNSSNLDSFNARFEPRTQVKNDKEITPEDFDFDNEKLKFEDFAKISKDENSGLNEGSNPSDKKPPTRPAMNRLIKKSNLIPKLPESPIKLSSKVAPTDHQTPGFEPLQDKEDLAQVLNQLPNPEAPNLTSNQASGTLLEEEKIEQPVTNIQDNSQEPSIPPRPAPSTNIFANKNKIFGKTKNHITIPSMPQIVPPSPQTNPNTLSVEPTEEKASNQENAESLNLAQPPQSNTPNEFISAPEETIAPSKLEVPEIIKPPMLPGKLPPLANPLLKPKPKPPQMVKPLPKMQPMIPDNKGGDKAGLI